MGQSFSRLKKLPGEINELLVLKHSFFAMPLALCGFFMAEKSIQWNLLIKVVLCFICARTAGMGINRILDRFIDRKNPRTENRILATGKFSLILAWTLVLLSFTGFHLIAWKINALCFTLSFPAGILIILYSFGKRFTWACHIILGIIESCAAMGGYLAVNPNFHKGPVFFSLGVLFFFSGFDIIYALLDEKFDRENNLFSIPSRFGAKNSLRISAGFHLISWILFFISGFFLPVEGAYWLSIMIVGILFWKEQKLAWTLEPRNIEKAFFKTNAWISIILFLGIFLSWFFRAGN